MNRIDKTVVFHPLGAQELRQILSIELNTVQQRVFNAANAAPFVFTLSDEAKDFLLREGTDVKYGARHLKRAVDRHLVHPLSNLIATAQVQGGDLLRVEFDEATSALTFFKDAEDMPSYLMARLVDVSVAPPPGKFSTGAAIDLPRTVHIAKTSNKR